MRLPRLITLFLITLSTMSAANQLIYIGTYTPKDGASKGIYAINLDLATGQLSEPTIAAEILAPTFLASHPNGRVLYSLAEVRDSEGKSTGGAAAFAVDPKTGALAPLGERSSLGGSTSHLAVDRTGRMLLTVSYGGGQITSFSLDEEGRIGPRVSVAMPTGTTGPHTKRQDKSHPHSLTISPDNRFVYVCDLGLDTIFVYAIDPATATFVAAGEFATQAGAGPRHSKISDDGKFLYVINELGNTLAVYARDLDSGALSPLQSETTLPLDFAGENITAEVRIHPTGRFVYGSNRGHDSIAVFSRDLYTGSIALIETIPCGGKHPRNFTISPDGQWLVCANRDTNNVTVFKIDSETGRLTDTKQSVSVFQAVCVLFAGN
jgi:6-phosphogluconolactonase